MTCDDVLARARNGPGHLARRFYQAHTRLWQESIRDELTGPQFTVLGVLHADGPLDQGTVGERARLDKSTTAPVLERLRQRGLVQITKDSADRRRKLLRITDAGSELVLCTAPKAAEVGDRLLAPLTATEQDQLLEMLRRIC